MLFYFVVMQFVIVGGMNLEGISTKCCGIEAECCEARFAEDEPIGSCFGSDFDAFRSALKCAERAFRHHHRVHSGAKTRYAPSLSLEDAVCCHVFLFNENDEGNVCYSVCSNAFQTPSLSWPQRFARLDACIERNDIVRRKASESYLGPTRKLRLVSYSFTNTCVQCFRHCLTERGHKSISGDCNGAYRIKDELLTFDNK